LTELAGIRSSSLGVATAVGAIAAVLFDWDGTLIDSRAALLAAWQESTEAVLGRRFPATAAEEREAFTLPGSEIWPRLTANASQLEALIERFQQAYERTGELVRAVPGIAAALAELRDAHVAVAVVTSKARPRFVLDARRAALEDLIDVAVCVEDAAAAKPDPRPVVAALEILGIPAANALMVGDTVVDVAAGRRAGTAVAGVGWGASTEHELREAGASIVLADPHELVLLVLQREFEAGHTS
jgi:HAD superfamily hydrolase (TIGR01509 family)